MGGSVRDVVTTIVDPLGITPLTRAVEGKPIIGSDITDPGGAKRAAKSAANEAKAASDAQVAEAKRQQEEERMGRIRATSREQSRIRERSAGLGTRQTILTSPLGVVSGDSGVRKTLLGA